MVPGKRERLWRGILARSAPEAHLELARLDLELPDLELPDLELLARWRAGERAAGEELYRRHLESLRGFFATKCRGAADELARRTLLASAAGGAPPRAGSGFRTHLFALARRELHRYLQQRRGGAPLDFSTVTIAEILAPEIPAPDLTGPGSPGGSSS
jgi:DNA-directed RNA polymerase specialized sigma24 family protein